MKPKRQKTWLVLAFLMIGYGIAVLASGQATFLDGIHEISGGQALLVGVLSVAYGASCGYLYFRRGQRDENDTDRSTII